METLAYHSIEPTTTGRVVVIVRKKQVSSRARVVVEQLAVELLHRCYL